MRKQIFTIEVVTKEKDGCGDTIPALSAGDIRRALMKGLERCDGVSVSEGFDADIGE